MSDDFLRLIPTIPEYIPDSQTQKQLQELFASFVPQADQVSTKATDVVVFVDQGENLERIVCPGCDSQLDVLWWQTAMNLAYEKGFTDLVITTPCCGTACSLNDLKYHWPAGFARFVLEARNPNTELDNSHIQALEQELGCTLRKIWAHY
jgi:hypothetical protein